MVEATSLRLVGLLAELECVALLNVQLLRLDDGDEEHREASVRPG